MPPSRPLDMPVQDFTHPFVDPDAPQRPAEPFIWTKRALILLPALLITATLGAVFARWLSFDGFTPCGVIWIALICVTFFWVSFVFCLSLSGALALQRSKGKPGDGAALTPPLNVAILMPVYDEDVAEVFASLLAMQDDLDSHLHHHNFSAFVLSDSQTPKIIEYERRAYDQARMTRQSSSPLYYRHRDDNRGYKAGNLDQWVRGWGTGYDAMLVLDADSLMNADAILRLTNTLARNPGLGLVQGALHVFRGRRLFARLQQFSSAAFGGLSANGLGVWSGVEGNYFGHNAIIRTRAFAACAGLPDISTGPGRSTPIFSHDFVEAALLRRAGWGVKILPDLDGSYEQAPETLVDYIQRDRRWCRGNMQHLRIMSASGLHPISRFHMFFNALGYLMSPIWLVLILIWTWYGLSAGTTPDPTVPSHSILILVAVFAMLLAPKFIGAGLVLTSAQKRRAFGGVAKFIASFFGELIMSMLIAPILMIHQTISVGRSLFRLPTRWGTSTRPGVKRPLRVLLKFHAIETVFGLALSAGIASGFVSPYLLPIAASLTLAPLLSYLSAVDLGDLTSGP
ncbi:glucans biosynthesis glucosyltransferase MdoH [Aliiroseovarius sp. 2305UL8-7]|uniref:glucans biosynthesis glucosyltransferase MdoH n=1 Tax=Aliiroseovarius conchicola TaxID=3121637 RepID=UPI0035280876